jgi:seryl-tRNA(Sec) selenium transferase
MIQIMTELQKKILEQSILVVLLCALVWYLNEQLKEQKTELRSEIQLVANRLHICESDRLNLSIQVAEMQATLESFSQPTKSRKKSK